MLRQLPNLITLMRIVLVLPVGVSVIREQYQQAFWLFALAGFSDGVDGLLARLFDWRSRFGAIADPVADKLLLVTTFVAGAVSGVWPWWFPPLVFAPFILDATATLLRRLRQRAPLANAHRDHFYQRAILVDGIHGPTVRAYAGWMAGCAMLALAGLTWAPAAGGILLLGASAGFAWYCRAIEQRWSVWSRVQHAG